MLPGYQVLLVRKVPSITTSRHIRVSFPLLLITGHNCEVSVPHCSFTFFSQSVKLRWPINARTAQHTLKQSRTRGRTPSYARSIIIHVECLFLFFFCFFRRMYQWQTLLKEKELTETWSVSWSQNLTKHRVLQHQLSGSRRRWRTVSQLTVV